MDPFYTVVEVQMGNDGKKAALTQCFDGMAEAQSDFFTRCASASISSIPYHAVYLIDSQFGAIKEERWDRRSDQQS